MTSTRAEIPEFRQASLKALSVLLDALAPFVDDYVVIGGWAPYLLLHKHGSPDTKHLGSVDLDLVFDGPRLSDERRAAILVALERVGCEQRMWDARGDIPVPNSFWLPVTHAGRTVKIQIDLIGLDGVGRKNLESHYALALKQNEQVSLKFDRRELSVRVSGAAAVFAMKAIALNARKAPKDAYDLYMMARFYKDGPESLAAELRPLLVGPPIRSALANVKRWFADAFAPGPRAVVEFLLADAGPAAQTRLRAQAFTVMQQLVRLLDHRD
jgi:hypothetical protein